MAKEGFVIKEKYPDGKNSVKELMNLIGSSEKLAEDARPLWEELLNTIERSMIYEFSHANPNQWPALKREYVDWKRSKGFPDTVGIMNGALKRAASSEAITEQTKTALLWGVNPDVKGYRGKPVGDYAVYFHYETDRTPARPLFKWTKKWLKENITKKAVALWVKLGWSKG